jgi:hypothetical protein
MKFLHVYLVVLISVITFSSCQKEIEQQFFERPPHMSEGSVLDMYIEFDTTQNIGLDTISFYKFVYDNSDRIMKINEKWFQQGTPNVSVFSTTNYFYNSTDSLPNLVVKNSFANGFSIIDTVYLQYNSNNMISKDSGCRYEQGVLKSIFSFQYDEIASWKYRVYGSMYDYTSGTFVPTNKIILTRGFTNNNVTQSYDSIYSDFPFTNYSVKYSSYLYDSKPNPFKKISLRYPDYHSEFEAGLFSWYSYNNPIKYTQSTYSSTSPIPAVNVFDITYNYNSLGYPVELSVTKNAQPYFSRGFQILCYYR